MTENDTHGRRTAQLSLGKMALVFSSGVFASASVLGLLEASVRGASVTQYLLYAVGFGLGGLVIFWALAIANYAIRTILARKNGGESA